MARIDWVDRRLRNWALWHERMNSGGLGFATRTSFLMDPADRNSREARMPVDEVEAAITDEGVKALPQHLQDTVGYMYLAGVGVKETARITGCAESTVHAQLGRADVLLAAWLAERKRRKEAEAEAFRLRAEAARPLKLRDGGSLTT